jgi:hypothetical protein
MQHRMDFLDVLGVRRGHHHGDVGQAMHVAPGYASVRWY